MNERPTMPLTALAHADNIMSRMELFSKITPYITFTKAKVLDAGSGSRSLDFLIKQNFGELWTASIDPEEIGALQDKVTKLDLGKKVVIRQMDLSRRTELGRNYFDIILADYFFAAVEGHTPFRTGCAMRELRRVIRDAGKLIVTGWNVPPHLSELSDPRRKLAMKLVYLRDCANLLLGQIPYRELPDHWITELAELYGFRLLQKFCIPSRIAMSFFESYHQSISRKVTEIDNRELAEAIRKESLSLLHKAHQAMEFHSGAIFGQDYGLIFEADE